jgi:hypothetical protein
MFVSLTVIETANERDEVAFLKVEEVVAGVAFEIYLEQMRHRADLVHSLVLIGPTSLYGSECRRHATWRHMLL